MDDPNATFEGVAKKENTPPDPTISTEDVQELLLLRNRHKDKSAEEADVKAEFSAAKKETEVAQEAVNRFIDELTQPTLFNQQKHESSDDPEAWRSCILGTIEDIATSTAEKLANHSTPLVTLGDLVDWQSNERNKLGDIAGIGKKAAEQIEEALEGFWARQRAEREEEIEREHSEANDE